MSNEKLAEALRACMDAMLERGVSTHPDADARVAYTMAEEALQAHAAEAAQAYIAVPCERCQDPAAPHATCPACNGTGTVLAAATQPQAAEPVAYGLFTKSGLIRMWSKKWFGECYGESCQPVPLYTHPQPARTFTDADIERAVRTHDSEDAAQKGETDPWADEFPEPYRSERMTAMRLAIDAAMAKESGR